MQNVLKHAKFLLSLIFLTEALHGQTKSSQNPQQTTPALVLTPQLRNFNTDKPNIPLYKEYNIGRGGNHYSQSKRPPSSSYKQYESYKDDRSAGKPLNINEEKMLASNTKTHEQKFQQSRRHQYESNSFHPGSVENNPHQIQNSKVFEIQDQSTIVSPETKHMKRKEQLSTDGPVQVKNVQRPIRLFPGPYNRALDKHLQEKEEKPQTKDNQKAPANSRKSFIREEATKDNSRSHKSEPLAAASRGNNHRQEMSSYPPRTQFENTDIESSQQNQFDSGFTTYPDQAYNSDSQTSYRHNYRPPLGPQVENEASHDMATRKLPNADLVQQDNVNIRSNFHSSKSFSREVLQPSKFRIGDLSNSFTDQSNTHHSMPDNLHLRQNNPPSEDTSRPVTQYDELQSKNSPDSFKQYSNKESSSQNNFNPQISGRNRSPYNQNSPDFEHRSTNKDYHDQHQQSVQHSTPSLERSNIKQNSKTLATNNNNLLPSQRLPHSDENFPSNQNAYSNEKAPSSHSSVQSSNHNSEYTLSQGNYPDYSDRQKQSEENYSDISDEYYPPSHQNNQNSESSFQPSTKNKHDRSRQELSQRQKLHTEYSSSQSRDHQELPRPQEVYTDNSNSQGTNSQHIPQTRDQYIDYSNEQSRSHQKLPRHQELHTDYSNRQNRNHQELPQHQELHTDYSNRQGRNHQDVSKPRELQTDFTNSQSTNRHQLPQTREQYTDYSNEQGEGHQKLPQQQELNTDNSNRRGRNKEELQEKYFDYSDENAPTFQQSTNPKENSQLHLLRNNPPFKYYEQPTHSKGLQQKNSDENLPTNNEASRTSKIPYIRSFTEGHLGYQESFQYLPKNSEFDDVSLDKANSPSVPQSKILSSNKKGRHFAIGDYSVENLDVQPVEYHSIQQYKDNSSGTRPNKRQGRLKSLPNVDNPLKHEPAGDPDSEPDSRLPTLVELNNNFNKPRSSRRRTAQQSLSFEQRSQDVPVRRSGEDDGVVKNLTFSATVERDHIVNMGSEPEPDSTSESEDRDDDDFGEEEHDGFLDMGAYTDKLGSFGWYADFPVGRGHDKMSYSSS